MKIFTSTPFLVDSTRGGNEEDSPFSKDKRRPLLVHLFLGGRHSLLNNPFFTWICWSCLTHEQGWMWDSGKLFNLQGYSRSYPAQNKTKKFLFKIFIFKDLGKRSILQNGEIGESSHIFDNCMCNKCKFEKMINWRPRDALKRRVEKNGKNSLKHEINFE